MPMQEKMNLLRMAGDQYAVHFTGMEPPVWQYGGILLNALNANHMQHFILAYNYFLRASRASHAGAEISLHYDDFRVRGQMTSMTSGLRGEQQVAGSFSFQLLVRQIRLKPMTGSDSGISEGTVSQSETSPADAYESGSSEMTAGNDLGSVDAVG